MTSSFGYVESTLGTTTQLPELLERRGVAGEILAFVYLVPAAEVARVEAAAAP